MSITKAFILGAGLGTRLRPLTNVLPKPLVPVWNEPLVYHALRHCQSAGINEFAINTHHIHEAWEKEFTERTFEGSKVTLFHEPVLLETGGGLKNIESFVAESAILIFNGDIITDIDLKGLIEVHTASGNIATLAVKSSGPNCNVAVEDGQIIDLRNTLNKHPGNHQFTGIYCVDPAILSLIPANEKISIIPAFLELARQEKLGAFLADNANWLDIGTIEAYREAHKRSALCNPKGSFVSPLATIDTNCEIVDSIIWPNANIKEASVLDNCVVYSSETVSGSHTDKLL